MIDPQAARFHGLARWMRTTGGACPSCAIGMAIAIIEKEVGNTYDWKAQGPKCTAILWRNCEKRARDAWKKRPVAEEAKVR